MLFSLSIWRFSSHIYVIIQTKNIIMDSEAVSLWYHLDYYVSHLFETGKTICLLDTYDGTTGLFRYVSLTLPPSLQFLL